MKWLRVLAMVVGVLFFLVPGVYDIAHHKVLVGMGGIGWACGVVALWGWNEERLIKAKVVKQPGRAPEPVRVAPPAAPAGKTRAGLDLLGLWLMVNEASELLIATADDRTPSKASLRTTGHELRGAASVLVEVAHNERASRG